MCRLELAGGGGTAVNRGGGDGAQPRRQCSGVMAHRRQVRGGEKAPGKQDGSIDHLGEGRGGREGRSPRQTKVVAERSVASVETANMEVKSSRVKGGDLHRIMAKLEEGLLWIGRSCGGLPTVSREVAGEELEW
jgi:hypothetical protein